MTRAELARELRAVADWCQNSEVGMWPDHRAVLEVAANLLEEEERDARRYRALREFAVAGEGKQEGEGVAAQTVSER